MQQTPLSTAKYELMHLRYLISGCSDMSRLGICSGLGEMPSHPQRLSRRESPPFFLCHSSTQYVPHSVALLYQGVGSFLRSSFHSPSESILGETRGQTGRFLLFYLPCLFFLACFPPLYPPPF